MKEYNKNDMPTSSVNEPSATYARLSPEHHVVTDHQKANRMTVDDFCNMLHQYVDEYYDSIQG